MPIKQEILAAGGPVFESVSLAGVAEPVRVYAMTGIEHDRFDAGTFEDGPGGKPRFCHEHYRARLVVATVRDGEGKPVFTPEDIPAVSALNTRLLDELVKVARRLNGLDDDEVKAAAKNSPAGPSA